MKTKVVHISRAIPGSGKSTFAKNLMERASQEDAFTEDIRTCVCSTDDFFYVEGEYRFEATKLGFNHRQNLEKFKKAVDTEVDVISVDNCNLTKRDYKDYIEYAKERGYKIVEVVFIPDSVDIHVQRTIHSVPAEKIKEMRDRFFNNLGVASEADYTFLLTPFDHPTSQRVDSVIEFIVNMLEWF